MNPCGMYKLWNWNFFLRWDDLNHRNLLFWFALIILLKNEHKTPFITGKYFVYWWITKIFGRGKNLDAGFSERSRLYNSTPLPTLENYREIIITSVRFAFVVVIFCLFVFSTRKRTKTRLSLNQNLYCFQRKKSFANALKVSFIETVGNE